MKFKLIDAWKAELPIDHMCLLLHVSSSGYYAWKNRSPSKRQLEDIIYLAHIRDYFSLSNETYGYPRMHAERVEEGFSIGKHRVARLMRDNGLKALQKSRFKRTTDSYHALPFACAAVPRVRSLCLEFSNGAERFTHRSFQMLPAEL